jgi:hypothetical protein
VSEDMKIYFEDDPIKQEMLEEITSDLIEVKNLLGMNFDEIRLNQNKILLKKLKLIEKATGLTIEEVLNES